jgi:hypothetical protein
MSVQKTFSCGEWTMIRIFGASHPPAPLMRAAAALIGWQRGLSYETRLYK